MGAVKHAEAATLVIVPGLRDAMPRHWQTLLADTHPGAVTVPPLGRHVLDRAARVQASGAASRWRWARWGT
jgi:hypothetical protein